MKEKSSSSKLSYKGGPVGPRVGPTVKLLEELERVGGPPATGLCQLDRGESPQVPGQGGDQCELGEGHVLVLQRVFLLPCAGILNW